MFRRRKATPDEALVDEDAVGTDDGSDNDATDADDADVDAPGDGTGPEDDDLPAPIPARPDGPWDLEEIDETDGVERVDLGALRITGRDGLELQVQLDEASGTVVAVTAVLGEAAVQIQPFAAPRSTGIWAEVRKDIRSSINAGGGLVDEITGPFGPELRSRVPTQLPDGTTAMQPARFVGVDGPRWFLRGVFLGQAATDPSAAGPIESVFRGIVVVRGKDAMAPGDPLPISLPTADEDDEAGGGAGGARPPLNPFERGPEITEIR